MSPLYDGTAVAVGDAVPFDVTVVDGAGRLAAAGQDAGCQDVRRRRGVFGHSALNI